MMNKELFKRAIESETGEAIKHIFYEGFINGQNIFGIIFADGHSARWNCWRGEYDGINERVEVFEV